MAEPMTTWELIKGDAQANGLATPTKLLLGALAAAPFWLIALHRVAHGLRQKGIRLAPNVLRAWGQIVWGADIWPGASIGPRFRIAHASGIVVGDAVVAGCDLVLFPGVILGGSAQHHDEWQSNQPRLGDRVVALSHAVVAGGIAVGDDVVIGANVVVLNDVPAGHIVRSAEPVIQPRAEREMRDGGAS